jgi:putative ABC transport system permease protein
MMILQLALKALKFEKLVSFCLIASLCSVIAPLLLLFSLRFGIITNLEENLKQDPSNLEIKFMSGYKLGDEFFESLKENPHVQFVLPLTRSLSVTTSVFANGKLIDRIDAMPTAKNDPLVLRSGITQDLGLNEVFMSKSLAEDLKLKVGDSLKLKISRKLNDVNENSVQTFTLKGIIDSRYLQLRKILINFDTLVYMEDYRDGFNPPVFSDGSKLNQARDSFAKARLYVKTLDDVEPMSKMLRQSYSITDSSDQIEKLNKITSILNFVFTAIALVSVVGGLLAATGLIFTNLKRRLQGFALLKLTGISNSKCIEQVVVENLILSLCAYVLSLLLFMVGMIWFNTSFAADLKIGTDVSLISTTHVLFGLLATVLSCAAISYGIAKILLSKINIADSLRTA